MATKQMIAREISSMCLAYQRRMAEEELIALTVVWGEAFEEIADKELGEACKEIRKRSQYFPSPAQIRAAIDEGRMSTRPTHLALTEYMPPEKRWQNKIKGQMCVAQICHKCTSAQAAFVVDHSKPWAAREKVAREVLGKYFQELEDFLNQPAEPVALAREFGQAESGPAVFDLPSRPVAR